MDFRSVDLAVALRAVSFHRMNEARKLRREAKKSTKSFVVLQEQAELDGTLILISHNVYQLRKAFRKIEKLKKRIKERREREKRPMDRMAGRNRG